MGLDAAIDDEEDDSLNSEETSDIEAQLEHFLQQGLDGLPSIQGMSGEESAHFLSHYNHELKPLIPLPQMNFQNKNQFDSVLKVKGEKLRQIKQED